MEREGRVGGRTVERRVSLVSWAVRWGRRPRSTEWRISASVSGGSRAGQVSHTQTHSAFQTRSGGTGTNGLHVCFHSYLASPTVHSPLKPLLIVLSLCLHRRVEPELLGDRGKREKIFLSPSQKKNVPTSTREAHPTRSRPTLLFYAPLFRSKHPLRTVTCLY